MLPSLHIDMIGQEPSIALAYTIARLAHRGQVDKGGQPYIDHPVRVARNLISQGEQNHVVAAGLLHDVVEDTDVDLADLRLAFDHLDVHNGGSGTAGLVVPIVAAVSRQRGEDNESYLARIIAQGPEAIAVKIADSMDNSDEGRLARLSASEAAAMRGKYRGFIARLEAAL